MREHDFTKTEPWAENEYIYVDSKPYCYTKYKHLMLIHFPGGEAVDISDIARSRIRMPKETRLPHSMSTDLVEALGCYIRKYPNLDALA